METTIPMGSNFKTSENPGYFRMIFPGGLDACVSNDLTRVNFQIQIGDILWRYSLQEMRGGILDFTKVKTMGLLLYFRWLVIACLEQEGVITLQGRPYH